MSAAPLAQTRLYERPALAAAGLLAGVLLLFQPAEIYAANAANFYYGLGQVFTVLVPAFLVLFLVLLGLARVGPARWRRGTEIGLAGVAVACWAGASFFTASQGSMDGAALLRLAGPVQTWINAACYAVLVAVGGFAMFRWPLLTRRLLAALLGVLALHAAWIAATDGKSWRGQPANERLATFSSERNVLVILLDTLQSDFFADALEADPALAQALDGFTYFPNAVGTAPTTYLSMPTIHSGVRLISGSGLRALYRENVVERSFVSKLAGAGYDAMLVHPTLDACPRGALCDEAEQLVHGRAVAVADIASFLANVALFRALPHALKPLVYRNGEWWTPWHLVTDYAITSNALLERMAREAKPGAARPTVRFLHLFNTHAPARVDARCQPLATQEWTRPLAVAQGRCGLARVALLLDALRRTGTYDASMIVLLADHGAGLPRDGQPASVLGAAASPTLVVKPMAARGPLAIAHEVVGLADVSSTICAISGACTGGPGVNIFAAGARETNYAFVNYAWTASSLGRDEVPLLGRYEIAGPPGKTASWTRLPPPLPEGAVTHLAFAASDPEGAYGSGWLPFEGNDRRWAVGLEAKVELRVPKPQDMRLQLVVSTHPGNPGQTIGVEINGIPAGEVPVGLALLPVELAIPQARLRAGINTIVFRFRSANAPSAGDARPLAALFDDLSLVAAH